MRQSESEPNLLEEIKIWKLTGERQFCSSYHLPISTKGETSVFMFPVKMVKNTETLSGSDFQIPALKERFLRVDIAKKPS